MTKKYIQLTHVSKQKNNKRILDDINLGLEKGKIYGFKGINGSGKTMLFRAILGLISYKGEIMIDGKKLDPKFPYPVEAGLLIESPSLVEEFTAINNLKLLTSVKKETITLEEMKEILEIVELDPEEKQKVKHYSLGMRQKLGLALAFISNKDLLVLDEPTNGLDEKSIKNIRNVLLDFKNSGTTVLVISHDKVFLEEISDKIFEVEKGSVHECQ